MDYRDIEKLEADKAKEALDYICGYRIVAPKWAHDALSGEGARKFGGRWNSPGKALVYLGGSRALSALELLVHLPSPLSRAKSFRLIEVKIPKEMLVTYPMRILKGEWRTSTTSKITTEVGDDWLAAGGQLAMRVPSAIIPEETNILLNPNHEDFKTIIVEEAKEFSFDTRL